MIGIRGIVPIGFSNTSGSNKVAASVVATDSVAFAGRVRGFHQSRRHRANGRLGSKGPAPGHQRSNMRVIGLSGLRWTFLRIDENKMSTRTTNTYTEEGAVYGKMIVTNLKAWSSLMHIAKTVRSASHGPFVLRNIQGSYVSQVPSISNKEQRVPNVNNRATPESTTSYPLYLCLCYAPLLIMQPSSCWVDLACSSSAVNDAFRFHITFERTSRLHEPGLFLSPAIGRMADVLHPSPSTVSRCCSPHVRFKHAFLVGHLQTRNDI